MLFRKLRQEDHTFEVNLHNPLTCCLEVNSKTGLGVDWLRGEFWPSECVLKYNLTVIKNKEEEKT